MFKMFTKIVQNLNIIPKYLIGLSFNAYDKSRKSSFYRENLPYMIMKKSGVFHFPMPKIS